MTSCLTSEQFQRLVAEQLDATQRRSLDAHIDSCPACQEKLARLLEESEGEEYAGLVWQRLRQVIPESTPRHVVDLLRRLKDKRPVWTITVARPPHELPPCDIPFPEPPTPLGPLGRLESYHIVAERGRGAFGVVFQAYDELLDCAVALKVLKPELAASVADRARFEGEARKAAAVRYDHIVTIHRVGHTPGFNLPYFVMEYIDGESMSDRLRRQGALPAREAAELARQVALGLAAAHARGLIHRDVKPDNILMERGSGRVKITDFGLARSLEVRTEPLTQSGGIVGTPPYMSAEQITAPERVDYRSDVYSLGVVLYELLTGERPFRGQPRLILHQVMHEDPRPPRKLNDAIPRDLETITLKCLAKEPGRRYQKAQELAADLERWLDGKPIHARPISTAGRLWLWCRRNPLLASLTAAVFALLAAVAGIASVGYVRTQLALKGEAEQRTAAQAAEQDLRQHLYAVKINLMQQAWDTNQVVRLRTLLTETRDYPDRGFEWYYWQRNCHLELHTLIGHRAELWVVSWSPDGNLLGTGSADGTAKVWGAASGKELLWLRGHTAIVSSLSWSPDGKHLATGSADTTAKVWDTSGRELLTLTGHTRPVTAVSWSPDGKRLATASSDRTAKVWDAQGGRGLFSLKGHTNVVRSVSWSPDGKRLATGSDDRTANVWDAANGRGLFSLKGHAAEITSVSWSPDGKRLATGSEDHTAKIWEAVDGRELFPIRAHRAGVQSVSWSPDGKRLATASWDGTAKVWEAADGREVFALKGHTKAVSCVSWSPDGKRLATESDDGTAKVWDAAGDRRTVTVRGHTKAVSSVSWSPDGKRLATGSEDGTTKVWEAADGRELITVKGHAGRVDSVSWSPDGKRLATGSFDGRAKVWDAIGEREILILKGRCVCWSPDGTRLATVCEDGTATVWETLDGRPLLHLRGHRSSLSAVSWSPDGRRLVTASADGTAIVWDVARRRELTTLLGHNRAIATVSWSPDGRLLATGSDDTTAKVWDATNGRELLTLQGHTDKVHSVSWSPDGKRLATASDEGTAKVWDASGGRELLGHTGLVTSVSWSPDSKRLAIGSRDGTAEVWEAASKEAVQEWTYQDRALDELYARNALRGRHAQGFIQTWLLLLPLPFSPDLGGTQALDQQQLPGEAQLRPRLGERVQVGDRELVWQEHRSPEAILDFNAVLRRDTEWSIVYAVCYVESDRARDDLWLQVSSDDQAKVYVNGQAIYQFRPPRPLSNLDTVPVTLKQGTNAIVFKVVNEDHYWEGCVRLVDAAGRPAQGIRVKLTPEP
jgi:WD40 repeat protein